MAREGERTVIDPITWFCAANACPTVIGGTIARTDLAQVTATYARTLVPPFLSAFGRALRATQPVGQLAPDEMRG